VAALGDRGNDRSERKMPSRAALRRPAVLSTSAFERVCSYVEDNLGDNVSLAALAQVAGMSRFHFARQFRLRTGESPLGYVRRMRIERAKDLLRHSRLRIAALALALGFADQSHFTRAFQSSVGMSPARYARLQGRSRE
jgi:AraC family transcriptional regulator